MLKFAITMVSGITKKVRKLRNNPTKAEKYLWQFLKNKKLGKKILRQKPIIFNHGKMISFFIADFFCKEAKLVIELDGKIHENQKEYDQVRDYLINELGYKVIRFTNTEIFNKTNAVLNTIQKNLK